MKRARPVARDRGSARGICRAALLLCLFLAASAVQGDDAGAGRAPAVADLDPMAVSPAMRDWVDRVLASGPVDDGSTEWAMQRLRRLHEALTHAGPAGMVEIADPTPTAEEAFTSRRADCLGFAMLFVALARERGIAATFALASDVARIDRRAGLWIERAHFTALYAGRIFEAAGERGQDPARDTAVSDRAAVALFLSNRGAQALIAGEAGAAVELFYRAVRSDPSLPWVWRNLGVALGRAGDAEGAVLAHAMAVRLGPGAENGERNPAAGHKRSAPR
jgi:tetratricopeptide (TPR) repeat protein